MYRFMNNLFQLTLQQCNPQSNSGDFTFCFNYCSQKPKLVLKSVQQMHSDDYDKQEAKRFKSDTSLLKTTINIGTSTATAIPNTQNNCRFIKNKQVNKRRNNSNKLNSTSNIKVMCYIFYFIS